MAHSPKPFLRTAAAYLFGCFLACLVSSVARSDEHDVGTRAAAETASKTLQKLQDPNRDHPLSPACTTCEQARRNQKSESWGRFKISRLREYVATQKCSALFGDRGPVGIPRTLPWWPVCSPLFFEQERLDSAASGFLTQPASPTRLMSLLERRLTTCYDACTMSDSSNMPEKRTRTMTSEERASAEVRVRELVREAANSCCGSDTECARLMNSTRLEWCQIQGDPKKPDACLDSGIRHGLGNEEVNAQVSFVNRTLKRGDEVGRTRGARAGRGTFPLAAGAISLAAAVDESGEIYGGMTTVRHELGHACSLVRRSISINQGDTHAYAQFHAYLYERSRCNPSSHVRATYQKLFEQQGASRETFECVFQLARAADRARFETATCKSGCPARHLEEAFAEWMRARLTPEDRWIPEVIPNLCEQLRDNTHPLGLDNVACFLKTPAFRAAIERATGCRK